MKDYKRMTVGEIVEYMDVEHGFVFRLDVV